MDVGVKYVLVKGFRSIALVSEWKLKVGEGPCNLLRMKEDARSMKRENSFPWHANPGCAKCQGGSKEDEVGRVGRTELGDVVGQASETCPRDENADVASVCI